MLLCGSGSGAPVPAPTRGRAEDGRVGVGDARGGSSRGGGLGVSFVVVGYILGVVAVVGVGIVVV